MTSNLQLSLTYENCFPEEPDVDICDLTSQLKIKVVPNITERAGLNGEDFDYKLSESEEMWFMGLRDMWNSNKDSPRVRHHYKLYLLQKQQPLKLALKLFANCPGSANLRNKDLAVFILQTTCDLHKLHPSLSDDCDDNTRMVAFNFVKTSTAYNIIKAVIQTYNLRTITDFILPKLKELLAQGYYKDVAYWAIYMDIVGHFDVLEIAFPLFLQDKGHVAEEYLRVAKSQQVALVSFLDTMLDKQKTVTDHCDTIIDKYAYKEIRRHILNFRHISKLVSRLAEKYKVPSHLTPNSNFIKTSSHMHYLYFKYREGVMSVDSWRELICDIANTRELQMHVVTFIATQDNLPEAIYWLEQFRLNRNELPSNIRTKLNDYRNESNLQCDDIPITNNQAKKSEQFLKLSLAKDSIKLVGDNTKFLEMLYYLKAQALIAFDAEWKPSINKECTVSLLQLATLDRVYLVDCISSEIDENSWKQLGMHIFNNMEILKIGFAMDQDLTLLNRSLPLQLNLQSSNCYLDMKDLWLRCKYLHIVNFPFGNGLHAGESLSALTKLCLGKKLDKSNQCSNWTKRPLRNEQIVYAALDAHCLILIFNVINDVLKQLVVEDVDKIIEDVILAKSGSLARIKQNTLFAQSDSIRNLENVHRIEQNEKCLNSDVKFICDHMLFGLCAELRKLGIDVIQIPDSSPYVDTYINIAKLEDRFILTRTEQRYDMFKGRMKENCFHIPIDSYVNQLLNVLRMFGICIYRKNLFTRCIHCNAIEFILVQQRDMYAMCNAKGKWPMAQRKKRLSNMTQLVPATESILKTRTTYRGMPIKLTHIRRNILESHHYFYICDNCGDCTWDGALKLDSSINAIVLNGP